MGLYGSIDELEALLAKRMDSMIWLPSSVVNREHLDSPLLDDREKIITRISRKYLDFATSIPKFNQSYLCLLIPIVERGPDERSSVDSRRNPLVFSYL